MLKWGISLETTGGAVNRRRPWGQMETFSAGGLLLALVIAAVVVDCRRVLAIAPRKQHGATAFLRHATSPVLGLRLAFVSLLAA